MKRHRSRDVSGPLQEWIKARALDDGWTAKQIDDDFKQMDAWHRKTFLTNLQAYSFPEIHTIRRLVRDMRRTDTSDTWNPRDEDTAPEDLRCILDVLAQVTLETRGKKTTLTKAEVGWILRIAKAAPSARSHLIWRVTQRYMLAEARGESTEALDTYLAFKPWESANRAVNYNYASKRGWIPELPARFEIDRVPLLEEKLGVMEAEFKDVARLGNSLDYDPLDFRESFSGKAGMLNSSLVEEGMKRIRERSPWLYHSLLEVWDDAAQKSRQVWDQIFEKYGDRYPGDFGLSADDTKATRSPWSKSRRLVRFFSDDSARSMSRRQAKEEFDRIMASSEDEDWAAVEPEWEEYDRAMESFRAERAFLTGKESAVVATPSGDHRDTGSPKQKKSKKGAR